MAVVRVVDGKIFTLTSLQRRMALLGCKMCHSALSYIFNGKRDPSFKTFKVMAQAMGMTLDQMNDLIEKVRARKFYWVGI